jgi:phospholipase/lecithinase/hemolysin
MRFLSSLAFSVTASAGAASALPVDMLVFGDSLSDPFVEAASTPRKQLTNGDTWAAQIGAESPETGNFAQSGAVALSDGDPETDQDFAGQIYAFARSDLTLGADGTAFVWLGGNDAAAAAALAAPVALAGGSDDQIAGAIAARIGPAVIDLGAGLIQLVNSGIDRLVIFTAPDIGLTPLARDRGIEQLGTLSSNAFNAGLRETVAGLAGRADISVLDAGGIVAPVLADPAFYGITELQEPCIETPAALPDCEGFAFFDPFHPTEPIHGLFADAAEAAAGGGGGSDGRGGSTGGGEGSGGHGGDPDSDGPSPVPLPASAPLLLLAGAGLLGLFRRKRRAG